MDRFRLVVRRAGTDQLVADVVIEVEPGEDVYDLSTSVPSVLPGEQFDVVIVALQGAVVLFESAPFTVTSVPEHAGGPAGDPPIVELTYAGPGADAATVTVASLATLLAPGGTRDLVATVRGSTGAVIAGVPLRWSGDAPAVASVSATGRLTAVGNGITRFEATTPTGVKESGWVYVASGEIAFVADGRVQRRAVSGGAVTDVAAGSQPAFGPGGARLAWSAGGQAFVDGIAVTTGEWPSLSPDGTKLAVERGGRVWFTNLDGSNPTEGPVGATPAWMPNGSHLAVGGGSIERVRADGAERATLVGGAAALPALGPGGALAFQAGSDLVVKEVGTVLAGASGRPAWSPDGKLLVTSAGGQLVLVDAAGRAPAIPLGLTGASQPSWRGAAPSTSPTAPSLRALDPARPIPGGELRLLGAGFDWIIPANTRVTFPGASGSVAGEVLGVDGGAVRTRMPLGTTSGSIRVATRQGEASIPFELSNGSIRVRARLAGDVPAPGIRVIVRRGVTTVGEALTDADGRASFDLAPGDYTVTLQPPTGFIVNSSNPIAVALGYEVKSYDFDLTLVPTRVTIDPAAPVRVRVGAGVGVQARAFDAAGNELTGFRSVRWIGSDRLTASGSTLQGVLVGRIASTTEGDAGFTLVVDGAEFAFPATVTSSLSGAVRRVEDQRAAEPVVSHRVDLLGADGREHTTFTGPTSQYAFDGLLAGTYTVSTRPPEGFSVTPPSHTVSLSGAATGLDFLLQPALDAMYVEGRVIQDGAPAEGIQIVASYANASASATTAADGIYHIDLPEPGSWTVRAVAPQGLIADPSSIELAVTPEDPVHTGADFQLLPWSFDGGPQRPNVMVCGSSSYSVTNFFPAGMSYTVVPGCFPDGNTQALLVTRNGIYDQTFNPAALNPYVQAGGIILTEYSISHTVWGAVFGGQVTMGTGNGSCHDLIPTNAQFTPNDPFWQANAWQPPPPNQVGCGYSVGHFPGLVPIAGWSQTAVGVGYRILGYGRVWATDFDWQDGEGYDRTYTSKLMGWMMTHRGADLPQQLRLQVTSAPPAPAPAAAWWAPVVREGDPDTRSRP